MVFEGVSDFNMELRFVSWAHFGKASQRGDAEGAGALFMLSWRDNKGRVPHDCGLWLVAYLRPRSWICVWRHVAFSSGAVTYDATSRSYNPSPHFFTALAQRIQHHATDRIHIDCPLLW